MVINFDVDSKSLREARDFATSCMADISANGTFDLNSNSNSVIEAGCSIIRTKAQLDIALGETFTASELEKIFNERVAAKSTAQTFLGLFADAVLAQCGGVQDNPCIALHNGNCSIRIAFTEKSVETSNANVIRSASGFMGDEQSLNDIKKILIPNDELRDCFKDPTASINLCKVKEHIANKSLDPSAITKTSKKETNVLITFSEVK